MMKNMAKSNILKTEVSILVILLAIVAGYWLVTGMDQNMASDTQEAPVACIKPYAQIGGQCCLDENENYVCDIQETPAATTSQGTVPTEQTQPEETTATEEQILLTENKIFYLMDYPELEAMFAETGTDLQATIEQKGHAVTNLERGNGIKAVKVGNYTKQYNEKTKNYVFVAIEAPGLENSTMVETGFAVSEDVVPYMKSYYIDSDVWMVLVHNNCNSSTALGGNSVLCIFGKEELNLGGCTLGQFYEQECYGE